MQAGIGVRRPFLWDADRAAPPATYPDGRIRTLISGPCGPAPSLFGLAPGGVCRAGPVAGPAVRSYRTVSPLPALRPLAAGTGRRSVLCGTVPGVAPAGRYPAPYVQGARTFLRGHLSVFAAAAVRPTDALGMGIGRRAVKACALAHRHQGFDLAAIGNRGRRHLGRLQAALVAHHGAADVAFR
jgi:hypothetical protein